MITPCEITIEDTGLQALIGDYFFEGYDIAFGDAVNKAYAMDMYGNKDTNSKYNIVTDFNNFLLILIIMYYERENDIKKGISKANSYYKSKYNIECYRKGFQCQGYNIKGLLEIFSFE